MTRVSFSDNTVDISLPTSWDGLDDGELKTVYKLMACSPQGYVYIDTFIALTHLRIKQAGDKYARLMFKPSLWERGINLYLSMPDLVELLRPLNFVESPGSRPVRPSQLRGRKAINAELHGVSFSDYIQIENAYQAYLQKPTSARLLNVANLLYRGRHKLRVLSRWQETAILTWIIQVKTMFSLQFPNLFPQAQGADNGKQPSMLEVMNNEIRALTGGDVSKEEDVFNCDCWRALTELDFKVKEARELQRKTHTAH